jgi:hypothetical protein
VKVASETTMVRKPRSPATRAVASMELLVTTPTMTTVLIDRLLSQNSNSVPMKALAAG